jgi:hypothetical protein
MLGAMVMEFGRSDESARKGVATGIVFAACHHARLMRAKRQRDMHYLIEAVGWIGATMILVAYGLLSSGKLDGRSTAYQLLNLIGSVGVVINSGWNHAIPSAALNVVWMAIGLTALFRNRQAVGKK